MRWNATGAAVTHYPPPPPENILGHFVFFLFSLPVQTLQSLTRCFLYVCFTLPSPARDVDASASEIIWSTWHQLSAFSQTQCPPSSFRCVLSWRNTLTWFSLQRSSDEVKNSFDWCWRFGNLCLFKRFFASSSSSSSHLLPRQKLGTLVPNQIFFSRSFLFWPSFFPLPAPPPFFFLF